MSVAATIERKLNAAFAPAVLELVDESHLHRGHAGAPEGGESHFRVKVVSSFFEGKNRVERQRQVNKTLAKELAGPVHALSIQALAPSEA